MSEKIVYEHNGISVTEAQEDALLGILAASVKPAPTREELDAYYYDCASRSIHPLDQRIYFTRRDGRYKPIVGIDFLRMRAESSGAYAGADDVVLTGRTDNGQPLKATATVWKMLDHQRCAFSATARWEEYAPQKLTRTWSTMPCVMLGKCAEALALRKAFPGQLAGLYIREEMDQAENQDQSKPKARKTKDAEPAAEDREPQEPPPKALTWEELPPEAKAQRILMAAQKAAADQNWDRVTEIGLKIIDHGLPAEIFQELSKSVAKLVPV